MRRNHPEEGTLAHGYDGHCTSVLSLYLYSKSNESLKRSTRTSNNLKREGGRANTYSVMIVRREGEVQAPSQASLRVQSNNDYY